MPDVGKLINDQAERLRKIVARHKAGSTLTEDELAFLDPDSGGRSSYDSLQSAATALGVPKAALQAAKDQGAPGFHGSRFYPLKLLPWLLEPKRAASTGLPIRDKRSVEVELLQEKLEDLRFQKAALRRQYLPKTEVDTWMLETVEKIKSILRNRLKNQLPPKLVGLGAPEIAARMDPMIEELINLFRAAGSD